MSVSRRKALAVTGLVSLGAAFGAVAEHFLEGLRLVSREPLPPSGVPLRAGPWGECYSLPFFISAPDEALPIEQLQERGTRWVFPQMGLDEVRALFESAGVPEMDAELLLAPQTAIVAADGTEVRPTLAQLRALPKTARVRLYQRIEQIPESQAEVTFIHKQTLEERFDGSGVSPETMALFHELCGEEGEYIVFSGLGTMLAELPNSDEKRRFLKALTRQKTMLLRVHVGPDTNVKALSEYWAKGPEAASTRTLLQSLAGTKDGTWLSVAHLLPPLPAAQLYEYPLSSDGPGDGAVHDCHWTSFNFFRKTPDPDCARPGHLMQTLQTEYYTVPNEPRYGDIVMLSKRDGTAVHSAVLLADDIVFTKNGATGAHPWMLSTIPALLQRYSFEGVPNEQLNVSYFRNYAL